MSRPLGPKPSLALVPKFGLLNRQKARSSCPACDPTAWCEEAPWHPMISSTVPLLAAVKASDACTWPYSVQKAMRALRPRALAGGRALLGLSLSTSSEFALSQLPQLHSDGGLLHRTGAAGSM